MADHTSVSIQVGIDSGDDQQPQPQYQQQQGWLNSTGKFHVLFGMLKLLIITYCHSPNIIFEVIYVLSLIKVAGSTSPNMVYWYLYIVFGTLGFELLLWTNLSLIMWLVINLCLLVYALASSGLLERGSNWLQQLVQPLDDMPLSEVRFDF